MVGLKVAIKLQADAELVWNQQRYKLEAAAQAAQRRLQDLEKVNAELQVHLDSQARAAAGEAPEKGTRPCLVLVRTISQFLICPFVKCMVLNVTSSDKLILQVGATVHGHGCLRIKGFVLGPTQLVSSLGGGPLLKPNNMAAKQQDMPCCLLFACLCSLALIPTVPM